MNASLSLTARPNRTTIVRDARTKLLAVIEIAARASSDAERPPTSVVFALDVSPSMAGEPLAQVVKSTEWLIDHLGERDTAGLVSFAHRADVLVPAAFVDKGQRARLLKALHTMKLGNGTNVSAGLEAAAASFGGGALGAIDRWLGRSVGSGDRKGVLLLSDGMPNNGVTDPGELAQLAHRLSSRASITTLGYGPNHDDRVLSAIAEGGGGSYHFIPDPAVCAHQLTKALGSASRPIVRQIELTLKAGPNARIIDVGPVPARPRGEALEVSIGDLEAGKRRLLVVELEVDGTDAPVLAVQARYGGKVIESIVTLALGDRAAEVSAGVMHQVLLVCADSARAAARGLADQRDFAGAARAIRGVLAEIERAPELSADGSPELWEAKEQLIDDAQIYEQRPDEELYASYRRNQRAELVQGEQLGGKTQNALEAKLSGELAGAFLIDDAGKIYPLRGDNSIGRSRGCDLVIPRSNVSRHHASVFALEGDFFVCDMGTTSGVYVDGKKVEGATKLDRGARIDIGDTTLKFMRKE